MAMSTEVERPRAGEASGDRKRKKTLGRQRIEIKPIQCPGARHVCFSKRRVGLFQKATELCALTGAQLAIVVFSPAPAGKPYSFAHHSVDAVIERYRDVDPSASAAAAGASEATATTPRPTILRGFDSECERLRQAIAAEARRRDELDAAARAASAWTGADDVRGWGMSGLVAMLAALQRVQAEAAERAHELTLRTAEEAMVQWYAAAAAATTGASDAFRYDLGDGSFTANAGSATSSHHGGMDAQKTTMLLGGNVSHAAGAPLPAFPPVKMLPHDLPPPPLLPFNYGSDHNHIAGNAGYCHGHGDDSGHGAAPDETEGYYGTMTVCNFFGCISL